jgi:RNA polymerase sigma-70 factor (ECF subfamily)
MVRDERELERVVGDQMVERSMDVEEIQHALDQLDSEHREAFVLKHVEELSYDEISKLSGFGVSALKMRVKRACDRLRQLLDPTRSFS